ncbi:hypothetical protein [Lutibacter sp. B1]|uniref:hypothetical protein n=1 Tax=Lutibacter sp. B1 TaxID=2725996 RepID=UPI00145760A1|nr:hypothetical protein [Lutibacter sp. B1]NLP58025.1 hypothetical protein [Lutibacter sp. B1]
MFKKLFVLLFLSSILSCSFFENKVKNASIQEIDTIVDFNSVDAFPLFPNCKEIPSRDKQQICFQLEMSQHIYASLKEYSFNSKEVVNDTVLVQLKVDSKGKTSLSSIQIAPKTKELLPEFDSIVMVSIQNLPLLEPAIKRDMPVTTEFVLPIVLKN